MNILLNSQRRLRILWRFLLFLTVTFTINIPLQLMLQAILPESLVRGYISASIFLLSIIVSIYIQARFAEKTSFARYGLTVNRRWTNEFLVGCCIAAVQLVLFYSVMYFTGNITIKSYFYTPTGVDYSFAAGFLSETFGQLVGAVGEELFFRSFLFYLIFESLRHYRKDPLIKACLAGFMVSLLFGLAHYSNESATVLSTVNLALDGIMLAIPFLMTGRLGMSIGIHFSWNLLQGAVFGAGVSGNIAKVSVLQTVMPETLLTGGAFGPEGSILLPLLDTVAVGIMYFWWRSQKRKSLLDSQIENFDSVFDGESTFKLKTV